MTTLFQLSAHSLISFDDLLQFISFYRTIAQQLKLGQVIVPETFYCVSALLTDIVDFSAITTTSHPLQVVEITIYFSFVFCPQDLNLDQVLKYFVPWQQKKRKHGYFSVLPGGNTLKEVVEQTVPTGGLAHDWRKFLPLAVHHRDLKLFSEERSIQKFLMTNYKGPGDMGLGWLQPPPSKILQKLPIIEQKSALN